MRRTTTNLLVSVVLQCTRQGLSVNNGDTVTIELMNADAMINELMNASPFLKQFSCHRGSGTSKLNAHQVSYLAASGGDSKGVHHVRLSACAKSADATRIGQCWVARL